MSLLALVLILIAAFAHATWNFLSKKAMGGTLFVWQTSLFSSIIYFPLMLGILVDQKPDLGLASVVLMVGSALLHVGYFIILNKGYIFGDLSLVYPLARGTGPVITLLIAIVFLREQPSLPELFFALLIAIGILFQIGHPQELISTKNVRAVMLAITTGFFIAFYTIMDKYSVSVLLTPPILLNWAQSFGQMIFLSPYAFKHKADIRECLRRNLKEAIGVSVLCPLAYILVLTAMVFTPVSYVAPAREISILVGTLMGVGLLSEGNKYRRILSSFLILAGVIGISI